MIPLLVPERLLARANALEASQLQHRRHRRPGGRRGGRGHRRPAGAVLAEAVLAGLALPAIARLPRSAPRPATDPARWPRPSARGWPTWPAPRCCAG
jgi:hypothetical protein